MKLADGTKKKIAYVLIALSVIAAIKLIITDYTLDEEYQLLMAYRNIRGDAIFGEMWEPHQTSAFFCIGIMFLYKLIVGSYTGVIIATRVATTLIQAGLSVWIFFALKRILDKDEAFLAGVLFFNSSPKLIEIPEFSNLQLWFFTVMALSLIHYYHIQAEKKGNVLFLIMASAAMAGEVLSYPSCIILFPVTVGYILYKSRNKRIKDALIFIFGDIACACVWLLIVLRKICVSELIRNLKNTVEFDLTHDLSGATDGKLSGTLSYLGKMGLIILCICVFSGIVYFIIKSARNKKEKSTGIFFFIIPAVLASDMVQIVYWLVLRKGYEYPQIHLMVLLIATVAVTVSIIKDKEYREKIRPLLYGFVCSVISILAVFYMSDLQLFNAIPHGMLGVVFSLPILSMAIKKDNETEGKTLVYILFTGLILTALIGKGASFKDGRNLKSPLDIRGIMKHGPAAGIMSDYMCCYIYNCNYEDFRENIEEGDKVLIVTNMVFSPGTTPYMFGEYEVCHFSIVDPTSYDERLLKYWEAYPDKKPDVIVVDCWYGELQEDENNWIMQYIQNDFGYKEAIDGRYVRFYKK